MTHVPAPDAPGASVGAVLKAAREAAGMTVDQVSASTRIRATLVRDLEGDRFESSGATVYVRGHLRAICGAVGADPAPLLAMFDTAQGRPEPGPIEVLEPPRPARAFGGTGFVPPAVAARERRGPRWGVALVGAGTVLLTVLVIGVVNSPARTPEAVSSPQPTTPAATVPAVRTPAPDSVASKAPVTNAQLRVRLISGSSWVSIRNATTTLFEGVLAPGQFKDFRDAARLKVIVGNAAAVDLNCGGKDSGPAGAAGAVVRFYCTKDGLTPA